MVSTRSDEPMRSSEAGPSSPSAPDAPSVDAAPTKVAVVTSTRVRWGLAAATAAGCAYIAMVDPNTSSLYPQCPFRALTGFDCPGCGITRALHSVLHGQFVQAANHNLLMVVAAIVTLVWLAVAAVQRRRGREPARFTLSPPVMGVIGLLVLAFWVLRNLPMQPFHWLNSAA